MLLSHLQSHKVFVQTTWPSVIKPLAGHSLLAPDWLGDMELFSLLLVNNPVGMDHSHYPLTQIDRPIIFIGVSFSQGRLVLSNDPCGVTVDCHKS